jgi:SEC-C motif
MVTPRASRNDPCPCRSGKKYKHCCLLRPHQPPHSFSPHARTASLRIAESHLSASHLPVNASLTEECSPPPSKRWNEVIFDAPLANGGRLHTVLLFSDAGLRLSLLKVGECITLDLPDIQFRGPATVLKIQPSTETAEVEATVLRVVRFRHDDDLGAPLHGEWNPPPEFVERWKSRRRELVLKLEYPDGGWCDIRLLRTVKWMAEVRAEVGATIFLDLSETGTRGWAKIIEVLPCGPVEVGSGDMVTGTFRHSQGQIGILILESEPKPIGVTPGHLFWSEDRLAWVPVGSLRHGETLQTWRGLTQVVSYTMTDQVVPVYNLEVEGSHCYRVGESAVLVHNQSAGEPATGTGNQSSGSGDPWWLACYIAHAANITPRSGSTPVVAVATVKEGGCAKTYVSFNLSRGSDTVAGATQTILGQGHWIPPTPGVHAETNIVNWASRNSAQIVKIAASRCICPGCVTTLGGITLISPTGSVAVPTCNIDGTPARSNGQAMCDKGTSAIPFNKQF